MQVYTEIGTWEFSNHTENKSNITQVNAKFQRWQQLLKNTPEDTFLKKNQTNRKTQKNPTTTQETKKRNLISFLNKEVSHGQSITSFFKPQF